MNRLRKYNNIKTEIDGITFDSKKEANRYCELVLLKKAGAIKDLETQPKFPLYVNTNKVCSYIADFRYFDIGKHEWVVEDVKSTETKTPLYKLKKKLLARQLQPVYINEV